ncbi:MAG: glycine betaine ABC transporter substrate-binding protein, partial [Pseudonocardiaceae bacterium]
MKSVGSLVMVVLVAAAVTACGSGGGSTIVIGSANFAESELLMEIYAAALREVGIEVQTRPRLGT